MPQFTNRTKTARWWLGCHSAISGETWGGLFKDDPAWQEGYTDGLSHSMEPEPQEPEEQSPPEPLEDEGEEEPLTELDKERDDVDLTDVEWE